jgi:hypothetical protein
MRPSVKVQLKAALCPTALFFVAIISLVTAYTSDELLFFVIGTVTGLSNIYVAVLLLRV